NKFQEEQTTFPCIVMQNNEMYLLQKDNNQMTIYEPSREQSKPYILDENKDAIFFVLEPYDFEDYDLGDDYCRINKVQWFSSLLNRFKPGIKHLLFITFFIHLLSISLPIYIMLVYDKVINAGQISTLVP